MKQYSKPYAEFVKFAYSEQVVASRDEDLDLDACIEYWTAPSGTGCDHSFKGYLQDSK